MIAVSAHFYALTSIEMLEVYIPTQFDIENITEGGFAPDCFGHWRRVTKVYAKGEDINGKAYVCFYTEFGSGACISNSLKEGELHRTVALTAVYTSHGLDLLEERSSTCKMVHVEKLQ